MTLNKDLAKRFNGYTIFAVYVLILVGGIVRSTGAGMGCPDWPRCFGSYIPPSSVDELPPDYEEVYVRVRQMKNERLATVLSGVGLDRMAHTVLNEPAIGRVTAFDPVKARIEYINRLVGVLIGFLIILNMVFSFAYRHENRWVANLGVASFVLVVFQGWVGSLVVSTNLLPGFITFHMILALLLVVLLLVQQFLMAGVVKMPPRGRWLLGVLLVLFSFQVLLGTNVREQVDQLHATGLERAGWIGQLGWVFEVHRSFSLVLLVMAGLFVYTNYRAQVKSPLVMGLGVVILLEILAGMILAYMAVPAFAQPVHLFLGTVAFGALFYLFLEANFKRTTS